MVAKIKETYLYEDYEIQLHKKRHNLKQKDLDVASYTEELQKTSPKVKGTRGRNHEGGKVSKWP